MFVKTELFDRLFAHILVCNNMVRKLSNNENFKKTIPKHLLKIKIYYECDYNFNLFSIFLSVAHAFVNLILITRFLIRYTFIKQKNF